LASTAIVLPPEEERLETVALFILLRLEVVSVAGKMTPKMQKFVDEYLVDLNATQAAIRAGYSKKTAYSIGVSNLKKPEIQAAIQKRQKSAAEKLEITRERVLKELASIGFAKATDFLTIQSGRVLIKDSDDVAADKLAALASVKEGMYGVEVKLADKARALEMLGKYLGLFDGTNPEGDTQKNNLFEAIAGAAEGGIDLNEIPEIQSSADVDADVVEET
jgi:phage terminase small subunit